MERARLPIIYPADELASDLPASFQRLLKRCKPGERNHPGILALAATLAEHAVTACMPPRARLELREPLAGVWSFARALPAPNLKVLRARAFDAIPNAEQITRAAIEQALTLTKPNERSPLDPHADRVVIRYATLAAYFAGSAVVLALDAIESPSAVLKLPTQVAGALAYKNTALGAARNPSLRSQAWDRAQWETERHPDHRAPELAVQLLHEALGIAWKDHNDSQRLYLLDFVAWATAHTSD